MTEHALACQVHGAGASLEPLTVELPPDYADESLGTKEKFWFRGPGGQLWLFKFASYREKPNGTDWAELAVHAVATDFAVPSACIALGSYQGKRGVLVRRVLDDDAELVHGNEIMAGWDPEYDRATQRENPRYTVRGIKEALEGIESDDGASSAFEQFASYLVLDALVAGRDRHHENWAVIVSGSGPQRLAPSYDHGNALGFAESEDKAMSLMDDPVKLASWLRRGKSHHFAGRPSLVGLAAEALACCSPRSRLDVVDRLESLQLDALGLVLRRLPEPIMSEGHRRFVVQIVQANRRRLLHAIAT